MTTEDSISIDRVVSPTRPTTPIMFEFELAQETTVECKQDRESRHEIRDTCHGHRVPWKSPSLQITSESLMSIWKISLMEETEHQRI